MAKGIAIQNGKNLEEMLRNMAAQNGRAANLSILPGGAVKIDFPGSMTQVVPGVGLLHKAYANRKIKGDPNGQSPLPDGRGLNREV